MKTPAFCKINLSVLFEIVILLSYAGLFLWMLLSGRIQSFLHPRMFPLMFFAVAAFALMAFSLLNGLKKTQRRFALLPFVIFAVPIFMACALPAGAVSSSSLSFSGNKLIGLSSGAQKKTASQPETVSTVSSSSAVILKPNQALVTITSPLGSKVQQILTDNTIEMDDSNIVLWVNELNENPQKYVGKKIRYTGYVFKNGQGFSSDEFLPGRDMMWCCAADIQVIGVLCRYSKAPSLKENTWVQVSGTLGTTTYQGQTVPIILNPTVVPSAKAKEQYVYPTY